MVYDHEGEVVATYEVSGWDIAYDPKGKSFWIAGGKLAKVAAKTGKVAFVMEIATWSSSSLAVHPGTGKVWVAIRKYEDVRGSKNQLLGFDNDGTLKHTVELGEETPFHVSVDPNDGAVWLVLFRKAVRRYTPDGKLAAEHKLHALSCQADPATGGVWVATPEEVLRLDRKGDVKVRVKHRRRTSQAWLAGG